MTRGGRVFLVLFVIALSASLVVDNPRYVFAIAALAVFGFLAVGFLLFPRLNVELQFVPEPDPECEEPAEERLREKVLIAGLEVPPASSFPNILGLHSNSSYGPCWLFWGCSHWRLFVFWFQGFLSQLLPRVISSKAFIFQLFLPGSPL